MGFFDLLRVPPRKRIFPLMLLWSSLYSCGQIIPSNAPLRNSLYQKGHTTRLSALLNEKSWNELFPNRYRPGKNISSSEAADFYSFQHFVAAANVFPEFLGTGKPVAQKRELAAFLANIAQETSGGWNEAPGGYFKWGLHFLEEEYPATGPVPAYADSTKKKYPPVPGKHYFGRGPKQFSWNYNYGQFSEAWFGSPDTLLAKPEKLAQDPVLSFGSAIWFWMTPQRPKPSCHDIMLGNWIPTDEDVLKNRMPGFGATVNVINGGVECGTGAASEKTAYRYAYYRYFCAYFKVPPGDHIDCDHQAPFGK